VRAGIAAGHHTFSSDRVSAVSTRADHWALERIQQSVASAPIRYVLWDGFELMPAGGAPIATIVFNNRRALFSWIWNPDLNFGEAYMFGAVDIRGDLVGLLEAVYRALPLSTGRYGSLRQAANDLRSAQQNVHRHYDIGNDFYRLWLDRHMLYTCAYFPAEDVSLEDAQLAKMDLICRKLRLQSGERVIGMGRIRRFHGKALRRQRPRLQRFNRADRVCERASTGRGRRRSRRFRAGRLPERDRPL
jgi:hypothetical protein